MSKIERIEDELYRALRRKTVFIQNLPEATSYGQRWCADGDETDDSLKKSVESMFSTWKKIPNIVNVARVGKPNVQDRKPVRVTLKTEEDAALILQKNKQLVKFKGRELRLHVNGYKEN